MPEPIVHVSDDAVVIEWPRGPMHRVTPEGQLTRQYSRSEVERDSSYPLMGAADAANHVLDVVRDRATKRRLAPATIAALTEELD